MTKIMIKRKYVKWSEEKIYTQRKMTRVTVSILSETMQVGI